MIGIQVPFKLAKGRGGQALQRHHQTSNPASDCKSILHPMTKKMITGFRVSGIVKRSDFGISPATPADMLSDDIIVRANVQLEQQ